jgi:hypothetical protein
LENVPEVPAVLGVPPIKSCDVADWLKDPLVVPTAYRIRLEYELPLGLPFIDK